MPAKEPPVLPKQPEATPPKQTSPPAKASGPPKLPPKPPAPPKEVVAAPKQQSAPIRMELRCICGTNEKLLPTCDMSSLITCRLCGYSLHCSCVKSLLKTRKLPDDFICAPCRVERVDEFHPSVGAGLLQHSFATSSSSVSLAFTAQAAQWRKQQWAVHLRAVSSTGSSLSGPTWPHRVQGKLNGRQCVAIEPPKHLHVRREQCYNLTPLLRQGPNTLELRFTQAPDGSEENYCVGVVLTRPRSVASIVARIRTRSTETLESGRQRVERLLSDVSRNNQAEEVRIQGDFGRKMKPLCPVSLCPIEEAAVGRRCQHVQVFDLQSYVAVNQRMRSLDKRWTCPVCSKPLRPDDVILDPFAQGILDTLRGEEEGIEAILFGEGCEWSTISAVKEDQQENGGMHPPDEDGAGGGSGDLMPAPKDSIHIDLSDDE